AHRNSGSSWAAQRAGPSAARASRQVPGAGGDPGGPIILPVAPPPRLPPTLSRALANRVRIIGGSFRGRMVRVSPSPELRPTPDRVRETLFNWLGQDLSGWRTLELYAGTGVLSLEALF